MSITEQIAMLESQKHFSNRQFDQRIAALNIQKQDSADVVSSTESDEITLPSGRRLIKSKGRTLSQVIIDERGSY